MDPSSCRYPCGVPQTEKIVVYHGSDDEELYDLEKDPDEFNNLWHQPDASNANALLKLALTPVSLRWTHAPTIGSILIQFDMRLNIRSIS